MSKTRFNGFPQPVLTMFSVEHQRLSRGAPNASRTNVRIEGRNDARLEMWQRISKLLREQAQPEITEIESLDPRIYVEALNRRLAGQPELSEPTGELPELIDRYETLKQLRSAKPCRLLRETREFAGQAVSDAMTPIRNAIDIAAGGSPFHIRQLCEHIRNFVDNMDIPEPSNTSISRLKNGIAGTRHLKNASVRVADAARQSMVAQLTERSRQAFVDAIRDLAAELVGNELRESIRHLLLRMDELAEQFEDLPRIIDETERHLLAKGDAARKRNVYAETSVFLTLPGPSQHDVISALLKRHNCGNKLELATHFLHLFEAHLRELVSAENPSLAKSARLGSLLLSLSSEVIADAFDHLFESSLGEGHSIYEIIERFGIEQAAQELLERAEPLCHLKERDNAQFNVTPLDHTVVRLPGAASTRDPEIRARLAAAFRDRGNCSILDAGDSEREMVSVVKIKLGWPIAIEAGNDIMLQHYAESQTTDHHPHLVGLLGDSPCGKVIPRFVRLAEHANH